MTDPNSADRIATLRAALQTVLDACDYTAGNCRPNEQVGAVLPPEVIAMARTSLRLTR